MFQESRKLPVIWSGEQGGSSESDVEIHPQASV